LILITTDNLLSSITYFLNSKLKTTFDMENASQHMEKIKYIDLFCGIGGFHVGMEQASSEVGINAECVFASDIDVHCQDSYEVNFGLRPKGDITLVDPKSIPDHDVLFAGFPCQPFSIIGQMKGFDDTRGTLFFHIANILKEKKPKAFILENVKMLVGHDQGRTLQVILKTLKDLDYQYVQYTVLNALDYGLPQKRERVIIVGHRDPIMFSYPSPSRPFKPLSEILEKKVPKKFYASDYIVQKRKEAHKSAYKLSIWHENKASNISSYPYSCALRAGASYNYLLVNGERRLTPREMFRLQGFPDTYKITDNDGQARKQAGNAVPVNMVKAVISKLLPYVATSLDMTSVLQEYEVSHNHH
jgi:DNA (cytosine-5)-methyltransferase 1